MQGTVLRIVPSRGFGFISPSDDVGERGVHFFHLSALVDLVFDERLIGQQVEFDSTLAPRGLAAENIRPAK